MRRRAAPEDEGLDAAELRAIEAVAQSCSLGAVGAMLLHRGKHAVVHLAPLPLVAKLRAIDADAVADLTRELQVAQHLASRNAPAARPSADPDPGPHQEESCAITLWRLAAHRPARRSDAVRAAGALAQVHIALADYDGPLPLLHDRIGACADLITRPARTPCLIDEDRTFLATLHDELMSDLATISGELVPLHGDSHLGNVLMTGNGALWCDLEAACLGQREWDIACLPEAAWRQFEGASATTLRLFAALRSLCVAAWCWAEYGRSPHVDDAAHHHLGVLKERDRRCERWPDTRARSHATTASRSPATRPPRR